MKVLKTIRMETDLINEVRECAKLTNRNFTNFIENVLREAVKDVKYKARLKERKMAMMMDFPTVKQEVVNKQQNEADKTTLNEDEIVETGQDEEYECEQTAKVEERLPIKMLQEKINLTKRFRR